MTPAEGAQEPKRHSPPNILLSTDPPSYTLQDIPTDPQSASQFAIEELSDCVYPLSYHTCSSSRALLQCASNDSWSMPDMHRVVKQTFQLLRPGKALGPDLLCKEYLGLQHKGFISGWHMYLHHIS